MHLPVGLTPALPGSFFGEELALIEHLELGQGNYAWTADNQPRHHASAVYLPDVETAQRLVAEFDLDLLFIKEMKLI